jgi:hypothetical protein
MAKQKEVPKAKQWTNLRKPVPTSDKSEIKMLDSLIIEGKKLESGRTYALAPYIQHSLVSRGHAEYVGTNPK